MERRVFLQAWGSAVLLTSTAKQLSWLSQAMVADSLDWYRAGLDLTISQLHIRQNESTTIWGDIIRIDGILASYGNPVRLVAREIHFLPGSSIDTRGLEAVPNYPLNNTALPGVNAGDSGTGGASGGTGPNAGDVLLVAANIVGQIKINADGRDGGGAQSGGDGAKGARGGKGLHCKRGDPGGRGGVGGKAGRPGDGGNGGAVSIYTDSEVDKTQTQVSTTKGKPGKFATNGSPGDGGPGGQGGDREVDDDGEKGNTRN